LFTVVTDTNGNGRLNDEVRACIQDNADDVGLSGLVTYGRINAYKAVINCSTPTSDTTPPSVSITSPANGSTVSGTVSLAASASDNVGITKVEFYVDGALRASDTSSPYSTSWDTTIESNASHMLMAKTYDAAGNSKTHSVTVTINNADTTLPSVSVTTPANGSTVSGTVSVAASASDNVGVTKVEFYVDGTLKGTDTFSPYSTNWDTTIETNASHTLQAKAYDAASNIGISDPVVITVDNTAPTIFITSPSEGATVSGNVAVSAAALDNTAVARVDFYRDGSVFLGSDTVAPYDMGWDSLKVSDGQHSLSARAADRAGNTASSASITVLVENNENTAPPTVNITSPREGAMVNRKSTINIAAAAFDDAGVDKVEFYVDGVLVCVDTTAAYSCHWEVPAPPNRAYRLQARAYDGSGQVGFSPVVGVTSAR
jgi:hypothetical protein